MMVTSRMSDGWSTVFFGAWKTYHLYKRLQVRLARAVCVWRHASLKNVVGLLYDISFESRGVTTIIQFFEVFDSTCQAL